MGGRHGGRGVRLPASRGREEKSEGGVGIEDTCGVVGSCPPTTALLACPHSHPHCKKDSRPIADLVLGIEKCAVQVDVDPMSARFVRILGTSHLVPW